MKKGDVDSKMLSALLSGVNRAYPFAKGMLTVNISIHVYLFPLLWHKVRVLF